MSVKNAWCGVRYTCAEKVSNLATYIQLHHLHEPCLDSQNTLLILLGKLGLLQLSFKLLEKSAKVFADLRVPQWHVTVRISISIQPCKWITFQQVIFYIYNKIIFYQRCVSMLRVIVTFVVKFTYTLLMSRRNRLYRHLCIFSFLSTFVFKLNSWCDFSFFSGRKVAGWLK